MQPDISPLLLRSSRGGLWYPCVKHTASHKNASSNQLSKTNKAGAPCQSGSSINTLMMGKNAQVSETCSRCRQEFVHLPWSLWTDWKTTMALVAAAYTPVSGGHFAGRQCPAPGIHPWRSRVSARDSADPIRLSEVCSSSCCHCPAVRRGKVSGCSWTRRSSGAESPAPLHHAWSCSSPACSQDSRKPTWTLPRSMRGPARGRCQRENVTAKRRRREAKPGV